MSRTSLLARTFATSARNAAPGPSRKPRQEDPFTSSLNVKDAEVYQFDDPSSLGWLRLEKIREAQELFRKLEIDKGILQGESGVMIPAEPMSLADLTWHVAQAKPFKAPTANQVIRIRSTIDLSYPTSPVHRKSVLIAPVDSLPLKGKDAIQRIKLLAGPRWTPGYPGKQEQRPQSLQGEETGGWIKIAEERFPDARTNRWNVGQMLEKLVETANVSSAMEESGCPQSPDADPAGLKFRHPSFHADRHETLARQTAQEARQGGWRCLSKDGSLAKEADCRRRSTWVPRRMATVDPHIIMILLAAREGWQVVVASYEAMHEIIYQDTAVLDHYGCNVGSDSPGANLNLAKRTASLDMSIIIPRLLTIMLLTLADQLSLKLYRCTEPFAHPLWAWARLRAMNLWGYPVNSEPSSGPVETKNPESEDRLVSV